MEIDDTERTRRGKLIAEILMLRRDREFPERYQTTWGTKTELGIYNTVKRLIEHPDRWETA